MYYSRSKNTWLDPALREEYASHGNWPVDAVEYPRDAFEATVLNRPADKIMAPDNNGDPCLIDMPAPTVEQIAAALTASVQSHMDSQARALNYDDIKTAVTYADEPAVPKFQAEGQAMRAWRSLCWAHCYAAMDAVSLGERAIQTAEELIAELPTLVLPE